jgi:hypothetical protein
MAALISGVHPNLSFASTSVSPVAISASTMPLCPPAAAHHSGVRWCESHASTTACVASKALAISSCAPPTAPCAHPRRSCLLPTLSSLIALPRRFRGPPLLPTAKACGPNSFDWHQLPPILSPQLSHTQISPQDSNPWRYLHTQITHSICFA